MSEMISVQLPDGSLKHLASGSTGAELASSIGRRIGSQALIAVVDGVAQDLNIALKDGSKVEIITPQTDLGLHTIRHSTAHVLAQAICDLYPGTQLATGPPIQNGFFYDVELPDNQVLSDNDLERIEQRMKTIIAQNQPFVRHELDATSAQKFFANEPYKAEIIERVVAGEASGEDTGEVNDAETISFYANGELSQEGTFYDMCSGPHVPSTGHLGAFKLQSVAGAYWRGDTSRPILQRIYGTAWSSPKELKAHLQMLAEAAKRDHRRLATELDLLSWPGELGPGLAVWHPKGALVRKLMEDYSRARHQAGGYEFVFTPHLAKSVLWETSGHLDFYKESMFPAMELDGVSYYPKPMNCPFHVMIYRSSQRSYRELPMRLFELGAVYRYELSGVVHGLMRSRGFTVDDSHIFCTQESVAQELANLLEFVLSVLRAFGFDDFVAKLSTRPATKSVGATELWDQATQGLQQALNNCGLDYVVDEGGGAFYGPKIDIDVGDAIGRSWQLSTVQLDFNLPERFDLTYIAADASRKRPLMIHRALFGSVERFFGVLLEHYAGAFPTWLAPVQVLVLPVASTHIEYANIVVSSLTTSGVRTQFVEAIEPLGKRVRNGKVQKVPYILVVGDDDERNNTVGVNRRGHNKPDRDVPLAQFCERIAKEARFPSENG